MATPSLNSQVSRPAPKQDFLENHPLHQIRRSLVKSVPVPSRNHENQNVWDLSHPLDNIRERIYPISTALATERSKDDALLVAEISAARLGAPSLSSSLEKNPPAIEDVSILTERAARAKSTKEEVLQSHLPLATAQGFARGVASSLVSIPFHTREAQLMNRVVNEPKPPLKDAFNNFGRQWVLYAPNKTIGSLAFMLVLPPARTVVPQVTDSTFLQKTAPYAICSFVEMGVSAPLWVLSQQLRLKKNVTVYKLLKEIYQAEGARGFYRGATPDAVASAVCNMAIFPISDEVLTLANKGREKNLSEVERIGISFAAGSLSSLTIFPLLKPVYQIIFEQRQQRTGTENPPQSFFRTAQKVIFVTARKGGAIAVLRELYKGTGVGLVRIPIASGVVIAVDQAVKSYFKKQD